MIDENVDRRVSEPLKRDGHDILYVSDLSPTVSDEDVLELANETEALLITEDKDFGELVFLRRQAALGVILIRLNDLRPADRAETLRKVVQQHGEELLGNFTVITTHGVRIRGMYFDVG